MPTKEATLILVIFFLGSTNATTIKFKAILYTEKPDTSKQIESCSLQPSDNCEKLLKDICEFIIMKLKNGIIEGDIQCTAAFIHQKTYTGQVIMQLEFTNPKLQNTPVNIECSVFPTLLSGYLLHLQYNKSIDVRIFSFITPILSRLVWTEETISFKVMAGLLYNNESIRTKEPDPAIKDNIIYYLSNLISKDHFAKPLYPGVGKTVSQISYIFNETLQVNYIVDYSKRYLQQTLLDPFCMAFIQYLEWGLLNSRNSLPISLGPNIQITLLSKLPASTSPDSGISSTVTTVKVETTTATTSMNNITTASTSPASGISSTATTVKGSGNRFAYHRWITWITLLVANLMTFF